MSFPSRHNSLYVRSSSKSPHHSQNLNYTSSQLSTHSFNARHSNYSTEHLTAIPAVSSVKTSATSSRESSTSNPGASVYR